MLRRRTYGVKEYAYTVNSNCTGGIVYFDDIQMGTIPASGIFKATIKGGKAQYTVRISGGVPGGSSNTEYSLSASPSSFNVPLSGGQYTCSVSSTGTTYTTSYTSPANSVVTRDSSVTMNYTSSSSSYSFNVPYSASGSSWVSVSGALGGYIFGVASTTSARDGGILISQTSGNRSTWVYFYQS